MSDRMCSVPGCGRKHSVHGLCVSHWSRVRKTGDVQADVPLRHKRPVGLSLSETFDYFMPGIPGADCWEWAGSRNRAGYGVVRMTDSSFPAHRVSYELFIGPIPEGWCVCHRCDNPPCCNPNHLFVGTKDDNNQDKVAKGRNAATLAAEDVTKIRNLYANGGVLQRELAQIYGVARSNISLMISRKTWRHVP